MYNYTLCVYKIALPFVKLKMKHTITIDEDKQNYL